MLFFLSSGNRSQPVTQRWAARRYEISKQLKWLVDFIILSLQTLEIPIVYEVSDDGPEGSPEVEYPPRPSLVSHRGESNDADGKKVLTNSPFTFSFEIG